MDEYVGELKDNWLSFFLSISCATLSGLFGERVFEVGPCTGRQNQNFSSVN